MRRFTRWVRRSGLGLIITYWPTLVSGQTQVETADIYIANDYYASDAADLADTGVIRLGNTEIIAWEASPAGTDITLSVDVSEILTASGTFSTPLLVSPAALGITPASGSNLNISLATTGDFVVNTNQWVVDTSAANVGIGTTGPQTKLHLSGSSAAASTLAGIRLDDTSGDTNSRNWFIGGGITNYGDLQITQSSASGGDPYNVNPRFVIGSTGSVGVGTTGPAAKLETRATTEQLRVSYDASNRWTSTVNATGTVAFDAVGSTSRFTYADTIQHPSYTSQISNWRITDVGEADFRYVFTDELHAKIFIADLEQALAGLQIIPKSVAMVAQTFTCPAAAGTTTLWVRDLPSAANMAFGQASDWVSLRTFSRAAGSLTIADCVGTITVYADGTGANEGQQSWTFTRGSGGSSGTMVATTTVAVDSLVLDYGVSGNGYHEVNSIDGAYALNSPYSQIVTWTTAPVAANRTVRIRTGNMRGITSVANEFGFLATGPQGYAASDGQYILASNEGFDLHGIDLTMWDTATQVVALRRNSGDPYIALGSPFPTTFTGGSGIWMGDDGGTYKFRAATMSGGAPTAGFTWNGTEAIIGGTGSEHFEVDTTSMRFEDGSGAALLTVDAATGVTIDVTASSQDPLNRYGFTNANIGNTGLYTYLTASTLVYTDVQATGSGIIPRALSRLIASSSSGATAVITADATNSGANGNAIITLQPNKYAGGTETITFNADDVRIDDARPLLKFYESGTIKWDLGKDNTANDNFWIGDGVANVWLAIARTTGNVGIGTTGPGELLDVRTASNVKFPLLIRGDIDNAGGYVGIKFGYEGGVGVYEKAAIMVRGTTGSVQPEMHFLLDNTADSSNADINDAKLSILPSGEVGIGVTGPARTLHVAGTMRVTQSVAVADDRSICIQAANGDFEAVNGACGTSSIRYKEHVQNLGYGLDEVLKLRPVFFNYLKDADAPTDLSLIDDRTKRRIGFIAEDMQQVIPEVVIWQEGQVENIDYPNLTALLVKGMQEMQQTIDRLEARLRALEAR